MSQLNKCPKCEAALPPNAPSGICPKCLLQAGLQAEDRPRHSDPSAATIDRDTRFGLPDSDALASHFPDLEIGELLGQGGMGAVYKARQTRLDRHVALKIIRPESAEDPSFAERFNREARTLARLNHPNIVAVYDFGDVTLVGDDGGQRTLYYFLMEYVDGANLRQLLRAGELHSGRALSIVSQICDALQFAHDEGIVHRDIKPENILVDTRGRVKIADFGLAKLLTDEVADYTLTGSHQVMGTPRYMAPEQMEGAHAVDHRADIYSLGVVFYEMLTGELPLGRFDPPSKRAAVDQQWDQVVLRALEKEPSRRYQNVSEVKSDVEKMSEHEPAAAGAVVRPAPEVAQIRPGSVPHYGFLTMGGVMIGLGLPLLAIALLVPAHQVFAWIGLGIALGGGGCCCPAFLDDARLPGGTRPNYGMMILGSVMGLIGLALMLSCLLVRNGIWGFHPGNVFIWVGMGLLLGGGGCCMVAWEAGRPKANDRPKKPPKPVRREEETRSPYGSSVLTTVLALFVPVVAVVITIALGPGLRTMFADFELTLPLLSTLLLDPVVPGVATALAIVSMALTLVFSFTKSSTLSARWNHVVLFSWTLLLAVYLLASVLPMVTLMKGLS
jgi:tRNA A-37 threonylcarbamoyl transferase component Bud32